MRTGFFNHYLLRKTSQFGQSLKLASGYDYYVEQQDGHMIGLYKRINNHYVVLAEEISNNYVQYIIIAPYIIRINNYKLCGLRSFKGTIFNTSLYDVLTTNSHAYKTISSTSLMSLYRQLMEIKKQWDK